MSDGLPPAGWYADPTDAGQQRYWDGAAWTEHVAPATDQAGSDTRASSSAAGDATGTGGGDASGASSASASSWSSDPLASGDGVGGGTVLSSGSDVDTWTWQSIVATILCCNVLGVVGVLNAGRAEAARRAGDTAMAAKFAGDARRWTLWSAAIALALFALGGVLTVAGALSGLQ